MDWIERCFGFSPDGGNGALENLVLLIVLSVTVVLFLRGWNRFARRHFGAWARDAFGGSILRLRFHR